MKFFSFLILLLTCLNTLSFSQSRDINIAIITDDDFEEDNWFESEIKNEIIDLLSARYQLNFIDLAGNGDLNLIATHIDNVFSDPSIDVIIGTGIQVSNLLAKRNNYPKPVIASIIIDHELQNIAKTEAGTSGIDNFTYVHSPFNLLRDVETLYSIIPFKKLGIMGGRPIRDYVFDANVFYSKLLRNLDAEFTFVSMSGSVEEILAGIPEDVDAIYLLPVFEDFSEEDLRSYFEGIASKRIPSLSLLSEPFLEYGAYASYDSGPTLQKIPRRIAINVSKVLDGINASTLPVEMVEFTENLIMNMKTANKVNIFPSWELLSKSTLIKMNQPDTDRIINLRSCIAEALSNNLELRIAQKETALFERDVSLARSDYLPQLDFSSSGVLIDDKSAANSFGTRGEFTWTVGGDLKQLILSEPALANIAIQKLFLEIQQYSQDATELDIVLDVAEAYYGVLLAKAFVEIQQENVTVTQKNHEIALAKEAVGYAGTTDVYRWESELALNKINLNDSYAQLKRISFNLNQILNRPVKEAFITEDFENLDQEHFEAYRGVTQLIDNPRDLENYADFLVNEAFNNLPEIKQLEKTIDAQNRLLLSNKRAFYLPTIALSGQYDYDLQRLGVTPLPGQEPQDIFPVWNAAIALQLPIYQGNRRNLEKQQTEIEIMQTEDNLADLRNRLELRVRSNLETARTSFSNWILAREAAIASRKNFEIAQNSYQQGLLNVVSLIDAQNAALSAELNANTARYQFMLDFMGIERAIGKYYFLLPESEQQAFLQRYLQFRSENK